MYTASYPRRKQTAISATIKIKNTRLASYRNVTPDKRQEEKERLELVDVGGYVEINLTQMVRLRCAFYSYGLPFSGKTNWGKGRLVSGLC